MQSNIALQYFQDLMHVKNECDFSCRLSLKKTPKQILNSVVYHCQDTQQYNRKSKVVFQISERKQHIIQQKNSFGFPCQWLFMDFDLPFSFKGTV